MSLRRREVLCGRLSDANSVKPASLQFVSFFFLL